MRLFLSSLSVFILLFPASYIAAQPSGELTASEQKQLKERRLVRRPKEEKRGSLELLGGTSYVWVKRKPSAVWRAFQDIERYPRMLPQLERAKRVSKKGNTSVVFFHNSHGVFSVEYFLNMTFDARKKAVIFRLDKSHENDVREAWGFMRVRPWKGGAIISFGVMADPGLGVLSGPIEKELKQWLLAVPLTVRQHVESRAGRRRYR